MRTAWYFILLGDGFKYILRTEDREGSAVEVPAPPENLSLVPSTHVGWFTTVHISRANTLSLCRHLHSCAHTQYIHPCTVHAPPHPHPHNTITGLPPLSCPPVYGQATIPLRQTCFFVLFTTVFRHLSLHVAYAHTGLPLSFLPTIFLVPFLEWFS